MIVGEASVMRSEEFADAINALYSAYIDRLGIFCWSAVFAFPPIDEKGYRKFDEKYNFIN